MEKSLLDQSAVFNDMRITGAEKITFVPNRFYLIYLESDDMQFSVCINPANIMIQIDRKNLLVFDTTASTRDIVVTTSSVVTAYIVSFTNVGISFLPKINGLFLEVYSRGFQAYSTKSNHLPGSDFKMVKSHFEGLRYTLGNENNAPVKSQQFLAILTIANVLVYTQIWYLKNLPSAASATLQQASEAGTIVYRYSHLLDEYYKSEITLGFYVKKLGLSSSRELYAATQKIFGYSPKQMMQQKVIAEAQKMLLLSDLPIKHIAYELGFNDPTNFNKFFSKHEDISPKEFRERSGKKEID